MVRGSVEDMYIIYTDKELEDTWKNMELPPDRITDRDIRHLVTLADTECYEQYHDRDEDVGGFWRSMTHEIRISPAIAGEGTMVVLYASNYLFIDKEVLRFQVYDHGKGVEISFGEWMDIETLEIYQTIFREWMAIMKEVIEDE